MKTVIKTLQSLSEAEVAQWKKFTDKGSYCESPFLQYEYYEVLSTVLPNLYIILVYNNKSGLIAFLPVQYRNTSFSRIGYAHRGGDELTDIFKLITDNPNLSISTVLATTKIQFFMYTHSPALSKKEIQANQEWDFASQINLSGGPSEYLEWLKTTNKKFFKDTYRRMRMAEATLGKKNFVTNDYNVENLERLIEYKKVQYKSTNVHDQLASKWKLSFLKALAEKYNSNTNSRFQAVFSSLYFGDTWLASHFGIQCNNILQYWIPVYNPEYKQLAPGRLLLFDVIEHANSNEIEIIDRGQGLSDSKKEMANWVYLMTKGSFIRKSPLGLVCRTIYGLSWRLGYKI